MPPKNRKVAVMGYRSVGKSLAPFAVLSRGISRRGLISCFLALSRVFFGFFSSFVREEVVGVCGVLAAREGEALDYRKDYVLFLLFPFMEVYFQSYFDIFVFWIDCLLFIFFGIL